MKFLKILFQIVCWSLGIFVIFIVAMLFIPSACFQIFDNFQRENPLQAHEAPQFLEITSRDGLLFEQGVLIHVGRDYIAFGKYRITELFDDEYFINKYNLVEPSTEWVGSASEFPDEVPWFRVNSEMRKLERATPNSSSYLTVWIDDVNRVVFIEKTKF